MEAATTRVSSKGQVVIPLNVRRAAGLKEGEKILALAIDDTIVLKRITDKTFEETVKPVWAKVRQLGLKEEQVDELIDEAKTQSRP